MQKKSKPKPKAVKFNPTVESPTWGDVQRMAEVVINRLGGPAGASQGLSAESFYALTILASLNLDEAKSKTFIFGRQYLSM